VVYCERLKFCKTKLNLRKETHSLKEFDGENMENNFFFCQFIKMKNEKNRPIPLTLFQLYDVAEILRKFYIILVAE
jgi:hypothetical protein